MLGALTVGLAIAKTSDQLVLHKATAPAGINIAALRDHCEQIHDMRWGLIWLLAGVFLQFLGSVGLTGGSMSWSLVLLGLLGSSAWMWLDREDAIKRRYDRIAHLWDQLAAR